MDLELAGMDHGALDVLWTWAADFIAISFVDGR